jgi:lipopolysaccharide/colanic/teichoic acid biosynthesis glycosyltransferase
MLMMTQQSKGLSSLRAPMFASRLRMPLKRHSNEFLSEELFRSLLLWERKRAERASRCFVLMLVYVERVIKMDQSGKALEEICSVLHTCIRETDVTGWYLNDAVLGVLFTELGKGRGEEFSRLPRRKLMGSLREKLTPTEVGLIHVSFICFPISSGISDPKLLANATLYPELFSEGSKANASRHVKRAIDIVGSILALTLCSPLFLVISLAIKLTSKGPILYKQERIGQFGLRFVFLKFRSMKCGCDPGIHRDYVKRFIVGKAQSDLAVENKSAIYKIQNDPRVTRVGRLLRKTSLDELPQFFNVLKGDMSLVGPRPPIPYELEAYQAWHKRRVMEVKPGITGLWQINGRSRTTFDEMVRLDLRYARTWTPWLDIKILLRTPWVILSGAGAY